MNRGIYLSLLEKGDDYEKIEITILDRVDKLSSCIYLGVGGLENLIFILRKFKLPTYQGSCPLEFGRFDSGYAGGALKALLSFTPSGLILIDLTLMSDAKHVAENNEIRHFILSSTKEKLAQFIDELDGIHSGKRIEATCHSVFKH